MIVVGVTTRNREMIYRAWLTMFTKYTPSDIKLIVYEDASDVPYTKHNNPERAGIAKGKNAILKKAYAAKAEHIFLFDDDTMPRREEWWKPFTESGIAHLNYMPLLEGHLTLEPLPNYPNVMQCSMLWGCLVYLNTKLLSRDYYFDERYGLYGYEHCDFTRQVFRGKDIPYINLTLKDIDKLIYSFDFDYKWQGNILPFEGWKGEYKGLMDDTDMQKMAEANFHNIYANE